MEYDLGPIGAALNRTAISWRKEGLVPLVIDGGGNVGYSALYFAKSFPAAVVVAVEADPETFEQLKQNCQNETQILPIHAALWSHERGVHLRPGGRDSWSVRVDGDEGLTPSILLSSIVERVRGARLLLIKLDIEGAEREVCGAAQSELSAVPCVVVEPHDFMLPGAGCLTPLFQAVAGRSVDTLIRGENLVIVDSSVSVVAMPPS